MDVQLTPATSTDPHEEGFTLIELLVVIIIIGILAAIAVPVFLNQRQRGYDAAAKSDLRNAANAEEEYLTDTFVYGSVTNLSAANDALTATKNITLTVVATNGAAGYCLSAKHAQSPRTWWYDSAGGGLQPTGASGCPVTTGTAGGSLTG